MLISTYKIDNFKDKEVIAKNIIHHVFSNINADAHVSTTINIFTFDKGGGGGLGDNCPQKPKIFFFKKINKMEGYPLR